METQATDEWFHCKVLNILTPSLCSIRVQTTENFCRLVFVITSTVFFYVNITFLLRASQKIKKEKKKLCHYHISLICTIINHNSQAMSAPERNCTFLVKTAFERNGLSGCSSPFAAFCSMKQLGIFLFTPDMMPVYGSVIPSFKFGCDNLSSWVKLGTMRVKCFAKDTKHAITSRGLIVRAFDLQYHTLTIRPTCLPPDRPRDRESPVKFECFPLQLPG